MRSISKLILGLLLVLTPIPSVGEEYPIVKGKHRNFNQWNNVGFFWTRDADFEDSQKISFHHWTMEDGVSASWDKETAFNIFTKYFGHFFSKKVAISPRHPWRDTIIFICCGYKDGEIKYMGMAYPEGYGAITPYQMEEFREAFVKAVRLTFPPKDPRFVHSEGLYLHRYISIEAIRKRYQELLRKQKMEASSPKPKPAPEKIREDLQTPLDYIRTE